ncbi:MAG: SMP-30/gluconolactonase/LRE family protein [Bacteroidota bacterium]|nr:SMP-30/gluconolactonase/LRE family protein [Bacteroidota bacterium]
MKYILLSFFSLICLNIFAQQAKMITTDTERDFIPEGIAIDNSTGKIYISSINKHKIVSIDKDGKHTNFITPGQDGFKEGLGLKVDDQRRWLWALSVHREAKIFHSAIYAFDLSTGKTMQQYHIQDTLPHLFNDLAIAPDGNIFITDTYFTAVYKLNPVAEKLELFIQSPLLRYPNGLDFGNNQLYIATYRNGLVSLDTTTKEIKKIPGVADTTIALGLDGLVFHNNSLYGIYNTGDPSSKNCVVRYQLSGKGDEVVGEIIIDQDNSLFADPTTAALFNGKLYVIANSHLDVFNKNNTSTKGIEDKLRPVTLLIYDLEK